MGSFESESSVTIRGSGEATEEIVMTSLSIAPDIFVEFKIAGYYFGLGFLLLMFAHVKNVRLCRSGIQRYIHDDDLLRVCKSEKIKDKV